MPNNRKEDKQSFIRRHLTEAVLGALLCFAGAALLITHGTAVKAQEVATAAVSKADMVQQHVAQMSKDVEEIKASAKSMDDAVAIIKELVIRHDEAIKHAEEGIDRVEAQNKESIVRVEKRLEKLEK